MAAAVADPLADELFWTDGSRALVRRGDGPERLLGPTGPSRLIGINCDGTAGPTPVGASSSTTRGCARRLRPGSSRRRWASSGWRQVAGRLRLGRLVRRELHFAAGDRVAEAAGCLVTDLVGDPLNTGRGVVVSADLATHHEVLSLVQPHLSAVVMADRRSGSAALLWHHLQPDAEQPDRPPWVARIQPVEQRDGRVPGGRVVGRRRQREVRLTVMNGRSRTRRADGRRSASASMFQRPAVSAGRRPRRPHGPRGRSGTSPRDRGPAYPGRGVHRAGVDASAEPVGTTAPSSA